MASLKPGVLDSDGNFQCSIDFESNTAECDSFLDLVAVVLSVLSMLNYNAVKRLSLQVFVLGTSASCTRGIAILRQKVLKSKYFYLNYNQPQKAFFRKLLSFVFLRILVYCALGARGIDDFVSLG